MHWAGTPDYFLVGGSAYRFAQTGSCSPLETVQKTLARLRYMRNIQPPKSPSYDPNRVNYQLV